MRKLGTSNRLLSSRRSPFASSRITTRAILAAFVAVVPLYACSSGEVGELLGTNSSGPGSSPTSTPTPTPTTMPTPTPTPSATSTTTPPSTPWTGASSKGSVPVTGGTLVVTADGATAIAADPDRDTVSLVDIASRTLVAQINLPVGAEPGRAALDSSGRAHVVLRRGGGIADIDLFGHALIGLRQTCALPRGIAYRASDQSLLVTCMTGELITMDADPAKNTPIASVSVHTSGSKITDLRDVLVSNDSVYVTTFRSANVMKVSSDGSVVGSPLAMNTRIDNAMSLVATPQGTSPPAQNFIPEVAWRSVLTPSGDIVVVHQAGTDRVIDVSETTNGGGSKGTCSGSTYGGGSCGGICTPPILISAVSSVSPLGAVVDGPVLPNGALPVDIAATPDGTSYIVALAGNTNASTLAFGEGAANLLIVPSTSASRAASFDSDLCGQNTFLDEVAITGQVTAVAALATGMVVVQTREPAQLQIFVTPPGSQRVSGPPIVVPLSTVSVANAGFDLFHTNPGTGMTCAGCHAEGQDDGRTWKFTNGVDASGAPVATEARRTQTFRAGFLETAPFHWDGQFAGMPTLVQDVFVHRMGASVAPSPTEESALEQWMNAIPPRMHDSPSTSEAQSIAQGKSIFEDATVGCATCHSGANFTNNQSADIGFGIALQVPSLIDVQFRAPYLHDGSALTLADRFTDATAMSGKHGATSQLSPAQITNLTSYLNSL
jgi:mono/diheme cytochrome c family protein